MRRCSVASGRYADSIFGNAVTADAAIWPTIRETPMQLRLFTIAAVALAQIPAAALAQPAPVPHPSPVPPREIPASGTKPLSLDEAKAHYQGPLSKVVLEFLTVMEAVVNKDKQPPITKADWAPLGALLDSTKFRRVGNFGVRNDWDSYSQLLSQWANRNWWKGYIWRMREVPGAPGQPGLVYLESEERSNSKHPVYDDGDYTVFPSIAVYEINAAGKITNLHVYDQRPM